MQSELNCAVCGNEYQDDNLPRLLTSCGHTYCESCLDTMMTQEEDGRYRVSCPEDGTLTYLDGNDVTQFPKNIALLKVIESKQHESTPFKDQSFDFTKIQRKQDSRGDESEQDIINQIESAKDFSSSREDTSSKDEGKELVRRQSAELCLPHQKPMDVVCLEDMMKICAKCAIFGEHKGHEFKSIQQIEEEWDFFRENIINLYSRKQTLERNMYNEENAASIWSLFEQSQKKHQKDVTDKFKRLRESVKKAEDSALKYLEALAKKAEVKISAVLTMDPCIGAEYKAWQDTSFGLILKTEECNLQQKLQNLYNYHNTRLVPQGQAILQKMQQLQLDIPNRVQNIIKDIVIDINDQVLISIANYIRVTDAKESTTPAAESKTKLKPSTTYEESLLESELNQAKTESKHVKSVPPFEQKVYSVKIQQSFNPVMNSHSSPITRTREVGMCEESPVVEGVFVEKTERPSKKRLKMIRVPEKYQKVLDLLFSDVLDVLDLTNAQLGDNTILQICEFLRGTKVRSVKFIRNKLTDEIIPKLVFAMGCVITLNLSQNMLTQHALQHLITHRTSMPNLKSVILSQNKIIQRKHRILIERLRKLDLTVSV